VQRELYTARNKNFVDNKYSGATSQKGPV